MWAQGWIDGANFDSTMAAEPDLAKGFMFVRLVFKGSGKFFIESKFVSK